MQKKPTASKIPRYATKIAKEILRLETLEARNSDRLDFHEVSVWEIRDALEAAYNAGRKTANSKTDFAGKSFRVPNGRGGFVTITFTEE